MGGMSEDWSCLHFSLANPIDEGATDLPRLLRRVADEMDARSIAPMEVLDLTIEKEIIAEGPWWSCTLYWSPTGTDAPRTESS